MVDLAKQIDFSAEIAKDPELEEYILKAAKEISSSAQLESIQKPQLDLQLKNNLIIAGLPQVQGDVAVKLTTAITNFLNAYEVGFEKGGLKSNILGSFGTKKGLISYLKYDTSAQAETCLDRVDTAKFGSHVCECYTLKKIKDLFELNEKYQEIDIPRLEKLQGFQLDKEFRDQIMFREGNILHLKWFDFMQKKLKDISTDIVLDKIKKTEFSINGTYLICYFSNGFWLYGGPEFKPINFYPHLGVLNVKFSPNELYAFSFNGTVYAPDKENFIVWNILERTKLRTFNAQQSMSVDSFKFSFDSKYIAGNFRETNIVAVFQLPKMHMIADPNNPKTKSPISVQNVQKIEWHSTRNILICMAYPQMRDKLNSQSSTKITVIEIPTRTELKWKAWAHDAGNGSIFVANSGDWVGVVMGRLEKKKITSTCIQIGNFKKKDIEIDTVNITEKVIDVAFDEFNNRFAVVTKDDQSKESMQQKYNTYFYSIQQQNKTQVIKQIGKVESGLTRKVLLANNGVFFFLANIDRESPSKGNFSFGYFNKDVNKNKTTVEVIKSSVLAYMSYCEFDPSGRFVVLGSQDSKSIQIWTVLGEQLIRDSMSVGNSIADVYWRPRSKIFLESKGEKQLQDDWKVIKKRYEEADDRVNNTLKYQLEEQRKKSKAQFLEYILAKRSNFAKHIKQRDQLLGFTEASVRKAEITVHEKTIVLEKVEKK